MFLEADFTKSKKSSLLLVFLYKDLYPTAALYAAFVGLAAFGWWQWTKVKNKQAQESFKGI